MEDCPQIHSPAIKSEFSPQVKLFQIIGYFWVIVTIWALPIALSLMIGVFYFKFFLLSNISIYANPLNIIREAIAGNWIYFIITIITPIVFIGLYLLKLVLTATISKILIFYCNIQCPAKEMTAVKGLGGEEQREVDYYHLRGSILRIMKWVFVRCPFPWLTKWAFSYASNNKYGKGSVLEDQFYCSEFFEIGKNVHIEKLAIVSSHLVDGAYGGITLKKIQLKDNCVIQPNVGITPGVIMEDNSEILMNSMVAKNKQIEFNGKYHGIPARKLEK